MTVQVGLLYLGDLTGAERIPVMSALVSERCRERILTLARTEDRIRSLGAELLLARMLQDGERIGHKQKLLPLQMGSGERGKPFLTKPDGVEINLSHSGEIAACAVGVLPVGVDVQQLSGSREAVARRCLDPEEFAWWLQATDQERAFCQLWALKESFLKMTGQGLNVPMRRVHVRAGAGKGLRIKQDGGEDLCCSARLYELSGPYVLAVCSEEEMADMPLYYRLTDDGTVIPAVSPVDIFR